MVSYIMYFNLKTTSNQHWILHNVNGRIEKWKKKHHDHTLRKRTMMS